MNYLLSAKTLKHDPTVDTDILSISNYLFGGTICRDRFNLLNHLSNIRFDLTKEDRIPIRINKSFEEITDERAQELIKLADGGNVVVLWSGGVDSTTVVSAFIRNGVPKDKLKMIGTSEALEKSPYFYDFLVKNGYEVIITDNLPDTAGNYAECGILVSGGGGDQLNMHCIHRYEYSLYSLPWIEGVEKLYEVIGFPLSKSSLEYFDIMWQHYAGMFDLELKHFCEFVWLHNFAIRFDFVRDREPSMFIQRKNMNKFHPFFMSYDFQCWAVTNFEHINDYHQVLDRYHYKMFMKNYTYSVVKDRLCFELGKHVSRPFPYEKITELVVKDTEGLKLFKVPDNKYYAELGRQVGNLYRKRLAL